MLLNLEFSSPLVLPKDIRGKYEVLPFYGQYSSYYTGLCSQKAFGVPFNITSYALLTHLIAHVCDLQVGEFIYTLGDYHIYKNHLEQVNELLSRTPKPLPRFDIIDAHGKLRGLEGLLNFRYEHLSLIGYDSHAKIAAPVAV